MSQYKINAYYVENGQTMYADRGYALGEYAKRTWDSAEDAEAVADDLRKDVGDVVDASVTYEVVECN